MHASIAKHILERIGASATEQEVVDVVRDYISTLEPGDLGRLPEACRPGRIRDAEDIADCAIALTKASIAGGEAGPILAWMESVFARACVRVSQLEAHPRQGATGEATW